MDIDRYVDECQTCKKESPQLRFKDVIPIISEKIGDIWEIDLDSPFRLSEDGCKFLVTMIDHFSKIAEVIPVYTKNMYTIVDLVTNRIIQKYGNPKAILTNNKREFENQICEEYAKEKGFV